jgi:hypothetical protein
MEQTSLWQYFGTSWLDMLLSSGLFAAGPRTETITKLQVEDPTTIIHTILAIYWHLLYKLPMQKSQICH